MKLVITFLMAVLFFAVDAKAVVDEHKKMRRILQHAFPDSMVSISERWNGAEDLQTFLDRAVVWKEGEPHITAIQLRAKEIEYMDRKTSTQTKRTRENLIEKRKEKIIRDMAIAELKGEGKLPANYK